MDNLKEKLKINWFIVIAYATIVVSYYDSSYGMENIKYVGFLILDYIALKDVIRSKMMAKTKTTVFMAFFIIFVGPSIIRGNSIPNIFSAFVYCLQLGVIFCYAGNMLKNIDDVLSASIGCFVPMICALSINPSKSVSQISNIYGRVRVYGEFGHPNTMGVTAMAVFIGAFLCIAQKRNMRFRAKFLCLVMMILSAACVVLSDSKNARYGLIIFLAIYISMALFKKFDIPKSLYGFLFLLIVISIGYLLLNSFDIDEMDSLTNRVDSVYYLSDMDASTLLIGNGITGGGELGLGWGAEFSLTQILYKTGIVGIITYGYVFITMYRKSKRFTEVQQRIFIALITMFLICCIAEPYITNITNVFPMYFLILLSALSSCDFFKGLGVSQNHQNR